MGTGRFTSRAPQKRKGTGSTDARPGDFPVGSPQSRAAARSLLASRERRKAKALGLCSKQLDRPRLRERNAPAPFLQLARSVFAGASMPPGDYQLRSAQSRAAARSLLERRFAARKRIDIICSIPRPHSEGAIHIGDWLEGRDGTLVRFCNLPGGMTIREAEQIASHSVAK